ncbi:hypothetical protein L596_007338 [Steinernema carpocapsae]|uniref:Bromo domain-containing protein n=1 Tax=Steinernema carpocapsae TaxID=34508 RepID=A0A4U5P8Z1_STECR|nr:hypothetical protein L596_007338 [Steinernema carpocapsae]
MAQDSRCLDTGPSTSTAGIIDDTTHTELLVLIERYLRNSTCHEAANKLRQEIESQNLLPARIDYTGTIHRRGFEEFDNTFPVTGRELLDIAQRLFSVQNILIPRWNLLREAPLRFLSSQKQSLTRTQDSVSNSPTVFSAVAARPSVFTFNRLNVFNRLYGRELGGRMRSHSMLPSASVSRLSILQRITGHLAPIFCVAYDRTGRYVFTGGDDSLIKIWDAERATLRYTFRGHDREISDISVNYENSMLATGSNDKRVRVFCLRSGKTLQIFGHNGQLTVVRFLPFAYANDRYLMSAGNDGVVNFYKFDVLTGKFEEPISFMERDVPNQRIISFCHSPGGSFVAFGDTCRSIRIFRISPEGVKKLVVLTSHTDRVDSMEWSHSGIKFLSGSKDGVAKVWILQNGRFEHTDLVVEEPTTSKKNNYRLTMLCWSQNDSVVVTTGSDHLIRTWNWKAGRLLHVIKGHGAEAFVLIAHPVYHNFVVSAGHDGFIIVWDVLTGKLVKTVKESAGNRVPLFDMAISPDGTQVAAVDCHGSLVMLGVNEQRLCATAAVPEHQFFHTDYRELLSDQNGYVLDAGTGLAPHLMPPPTAVDGSGFEHSQQFQRLVPGRDSDGCETAVELQCVWLTKNIVDPLTPQVSEDNFERRMSIRAEEDKAEYDTSAPLNIISPSIARARAAKRTGQRSAAVPEPPPPPLLDLSSSSNDSTYSESHDVGSDARDSGSDEAEELVVEEEESSDSDFNLEESQRSARRTQRRNNEPSRRSGRNREESSSHRRSSRGRRSRNGESVASDHASSSPTSSSHAESRFQRPRRRQRRERSSENEDDNSRVSLESATRSRPRRQRNPCENDASPEKHPEFSPWMELVSPKRFPYIPQVGDEVVYFLQGHIEYIKAITSKKLYQVDRKMQPPPHSKPDEFCIVLKVTYELAHSPYCRVLKVKLGVLDSRRRISKEFSVWMHDVENVPDFLILRQLYDKSITADHQRIGTKMQAILSNQWWVGKIQMKNQNEDYPLCQWLSISIRWDNGEEEVLSPWDYEVCDARSKVRSETLVNEEDLVAYGEFPPKRGDWTEIIDGETHQSESEARQKLTDYVRTSIERLLTIRELKEWADPVNLQLHTEYTEVVLYPIDLGTISERLRNKYYRRKLSLLLDVWYLAENTKKYNEKNSVIVTQAKVLVETLSRVINDDSCSLDPVEAYHDFMNGDPKDAVFWKHMPQATDDYVKKHVEIGSTSSQNVHGDLQKCVPWVREASDILDELIVKYRTFDPNNEESNVILGRIYEHQQSLRELQQRMVHGEFENPKSFESEVEEFFGVVKREVEDDRHSSIYRDCLNFHNELTQRIRNVSSAFERENISSDHGGHALRVRNERHQTRYNTRLSDKRQVSSTQVAPDVRPNGRPSRAAASVRNYNDVVNGLNLSEDEPGPSRRSLPTVQEQDEPTSSRNSRAQQRSGGRNRRRVVESESEKSEASRDENWSDNEEPEDEDEEEQIEEEEEEDAGRSSHSSNDRPVRKRRQNPRYESEESSASSGRPKRKKRREEKKQSTRRLPTRSARRQQYVDSEDSY